MPTSTRSGFLRIIPDSPMGGARSVRAEDWENFSCLVTKHIDDYTVPQYGDYPYDQITNWSFQDIKTCILRYVNRMGTSLRGKDEALRDMFKIAHYAQVAHDKLKEQKDESTKDTL